jgi:hypothetical protein
MTHKVLLSIPKVFVSDRGKKTIYIKEKRSLPFKKWIIHNNQPVHEDDCRNLPISLMMEFNHSSICSGTLMMS